MGYLDFSFDGINARDMNVRSVRVEEAIMTFPFISDSSFTTSKPIGRIDTNLHRVTRDNIVIPLTLLLVDKNGDPKIWTDRDIRRIADWLITDDYKPLTLGNSKGIMYNAIVANSENISHYADGGVLTIEFSTDSPYAWTVPIYEEFDLTGESRELILINKSNVEKYYRPTFEITNASGSVAITNNTLDDQPLELEGIYEDEKITINNDWELIESDKPAVKFHDRFNYNFLRLRQGVNNISVEGKCKLVLKYQFPIVS